MKLFKIKKNSIQNFFNLVNIKNIQFLNYCFQSFDFNFFRYHDILY